MSPLFTGSKFGFLQNLSGGSGVSEPIDPYFTNISLLLLGSGTNNSTRIVDDSNTYKRLNIFGGTKISTTQSKFGGSSVYFDGNGDYLSVDYSSDIDLVGSAFTIEAWIYVESIKANGTRIASAGGGAVGFNSTNGIHWLMQLGSSGEVQIQIRTSGGAGSVSSIGTVSTNTWTHVAVCVSGSTGYAFVNGIGNSSSLGTIQRPSTNPTLNIGTIPGETGNTTYAFPGYISNFRITKGIARYTSDFSIPTSAFPKRGNVLSNWTPSVITTGLWLDGSDSNTITQSGGLVSQWSDKSGNNRHFTQSDSSLQPAFTSNAQNGLSALTFDGVNDSLARTLYSYGSTHSLFIAFKYTGGSEITTSTQFSLTSGFDAGLGWAGIFAGSAWSGYTVQINSRLGYYQPLFGGGTGGFFKTQNISSTTPSIVCFAFNTFYNSVTKLNGTLDFLTSGGSGIPTAIDTIGSRTSNSYPFAGLIYEFIITQSYLSVNAIERMEGYLAWKWGTVSNLPSDHPYKSSAPLYTSS